MVRTCIDQPFGKLAVLLTEAFRLYKATLKNINWSVCAETPTGELVISLWSHHFRPIDNGIKYTDNASRWSGHGNNELRKALDKAKEGNQTIRAVIATTDNPKAVDKGVAADNFNNTFSVPKDWIGTLTLWDGDNFEIEFTKDKVNS